MKVARFGDLSNVEKALFRPTASITIDAVS
jgi:hypothetical protein